MKKILLLACILTLAACGSKQSATYRNVLPKDAMMVVGVNLKSVVGKMGADDFADSALSRVIGEDMTEEERTLIMPLLADPAKSGLSTGDDVYVFVTQEQAVGVLARVDNAAKVGDIVAKAGFTALIEGGRHSAGRMDNRTAVAVWDDNVFLFYRSDKPYAETSPVMQTLLSQENKESLISFKPAAKALAAANDFCAVVNYNAATAQALALMNGGAQGGIPGSYMDLLKDARYIVTGNFEKGRMVVDMTMAFGSGENEKAYRDFASKLSGKVDGRLLKYIPETSLVTVAGHIHGSVLYEMMASMPEAGRFMQQASPVKSVMESIDGDIVMALTAYSGEIPSFVVLAELSKPEVIQGFLGMAAAIGAQPDGDGFVFSVMGFTVHFGVTGKMFYASNDQAAISAIKGGNIASVEGRFGNVLKSYGGIAVDLAAGGEVLKKNNLMDIDELLPLLGMFGTLECSSLDHERSHLVLTTTDPKKNAARVLYEALQTAAAAE